MISIWLCPTHEDELYLQKIINKLSENYNSPIFLPHCTLLGGIKLNEFDLRQWNQAEFYLKYRKCN